MNSVMWKTQIKSLNLIVKMESTVNRGIPLNSPKHWGNLSKPGFELLKNSAMLLHQTLNFLNILNIFIHHRLDTLSNHKRCLKVHYETFLQACKQTKDRALDTRNSSLQEITWLLDVLKRCNVTFNY